MPKSIFHFDSKGIGRLLKDGRLIVPPNQRSYAWEEIHVRSLLEDLNEAISNDATDYFLGTIVLVQKGPETPCIADGQQRLATISILLARIRDLLYSLSRDKGADSVDSDFLRTINRDTEIMSPRLQLNTEDHEFFETHILLSPKDVEYANRPKPIRTSNMRLQKASLLIDSYLGELLQTLRTDAHPERLLKWVSFIENSVSVVVVTAPDEIGAFRIFETLNDRGLRASQADILKNYFFSKSGSRLSEAQMMWNKIAQGVESIEDEEEGALVTYIRHFWVTTHGPTKERELAAQIKKEIIGESRAMRFLSEASAAVQDYLALSNPHHIKWAPYPESVRKNVETISDHLKIEQIRPLMFAVAMNFNTVETEKAFKLFVSWSVRFLIYGGRGGMLDLQYSNRAKDVGTKQVSKARDLREAMKKYVPSNKEFQDAFSTARISRAHLARYYLRALEQTENNIPHPEYVANEDVKDINLEHILPITPIKSWNFDEEEAEAMQRRLGNMVLMKADKNRDLGNASFSLKKKAYAGSGYTLTKQIAQYKKWTSDEIRERQENLAKLAVKTWSLDLSK